MKARESGDLDCAIKMGTKHQKLAMNQENCFETVSNEEKIASLMTVLKILQPFVL